MDTLLTGLYTLAFIAVTEFAKRIKANDLFGAGTIVFCAVIGLGAGYLHLGGLNLLTGFVAGLSASGIHTVAQNVGNK